MENSTNFRVLCHKLTKQFFEKKWVKNFTLRGGLLIMTQVLVRRFRRHIKHWNRLFLAKDIKEKPFLYRPSGNPVFSKLFFYKKGHNFFLIMPMRELKCFLESLRYKIAKYAYVFTFCWTLSSEIHYTVSMKALLSVRDTY